MNTRLLSISLLVVLLVGGCGARPDYVATPFFSEAAFRNIRPGMSEDGVRTLLGYPASRFGPIDDPTGAKGPKITWNYAAPASWEPPLRFHDFSVTFGPDRLVSGTLTCEASWEWHDGVRQSIEAVQQSRRKIGDVVLTKPDGSTNVLRASDPGLYVILLDRDVSEGPRLNSGPAWLGEAAPELLRKGSIAGIKHFYMGHRPADYEELVKELSPETARECYLDAEPEFNFTVWDLGSRMVLYKTGTIWSVPPGVYAFANGDLAADDQKWLILRLGTELANGRQPTAR